MKPDSPTSPSPDIDRVSTREGYDRWADIYDDENNPLILLEEPRVDELLGEIGGLSVVDVGCGTGRHALRFAAGGAHVTALDFSEGMLAKARAKPDAEQVRWLRHDLAQPLPLADASFDRVTCCLVLEHIENLNDLFAQMARVCKPDGSVIISAMHPAMMLRGLTARFTDPRTGRETRPQSHDNQISDFLAAALGAGLALDRISEHFVDRDLVARSARAEKYLGWPLLLLMRFGKSA